MHFRWFSKSNWSFRNRKKIPGILYLLRSCFNIIRMDFHQILRPINLFSWGDSTFFKHVMNFRKCPGWYEISTVFYRKALHRRRMTILADPKQLFSPKTPNHPSEIFDFKNKILESVLYHPETSSQ